MSSYSPASLVPITSAEVVVLDGGTMRSTDEPSVTLSGPDAQRIADLWRGLPPGEQARCHVPPYGIRFRSGERVVCQASICWECSNILGDAEVGRIHYAFDAESPTSRALLEELRRAVGDPEVE